jgi:hypothetical protein
MKKLYLVIGIVVILALVCSPVLAISKSELIAQYKTGYFPGPTTPTPMPTVVPTTGPTNIPTGTGTGTLSVQSNPGETNVYLDGEWKGVTPKYSGMSYTSVFDGDGTNAHALTLAGIPAGPHQLTFTKEGYKDYSKSVTVTEGETTHVYARLTPISPDPTPTPTPTVTPTAVPTRAPSNWPYPIVPDPYIKTKSSYLDSLSEYFPQKWPVKPDTAVFSDSTAVSGKPNIYLYSDQDLTALVRLAPEYAITISDPVYRPGIGWLAEIRNGSLNEAGDFLFYEAIVPAYGWQKEEGYVIRAAYREQDMASMLGQYGFNEKETAEFIDYWANHLVEDTDFVFYPQETEAVNRDMPLTIRPEPDHVMRIWYLAEPLVSAPEPVTSPERIVREGFYVVEWGVIITHDEYWINHSPASSEVVL